MILKISPTEWEHEFPIGDYSETNYITATDDGLLVRFDTISWAELDEARGAVGLPTPKPAAWIYWADNGDGTESQNVYVSAVLPSYIKPTREPEPLYRRVTESTS